MKRKKKKKKKKKKAQQRNDSYHNTTPLTSGLPKSVIYNEVGLTIIGPPKNCWARTNGTPTFLFSA